MFIYGISQHLTINLCMGSQVIVMSGNRFRLQFEIASSLFRPRIFWNRKWSHHQDGSRLRTFQCLIIRPPPPGEYFNLLRPYIIFCHLLYIFSLTFTGSIYVKRYKHSTTMVGAIARQSKVFYQGQTEDFVIFVADMVTAQKWETDHSIPFEQAMDVWKIYSSHR